MRNQPDLFAQAAPTKAAKVTPTTNAYYDEYDRLLHYCQCGEWGAFGYNVDLRNGKLGNWYCFEHRP
jgi:hypothetical protein